MTKVIEENELLEKEDIREKYLSKIEELEKVKSLILLPNTELMTTRAVAEYFEVDNKTIQKNFERNRDELIQNGVTFKKHHEIKDLINADNMSLLKIPPRGTNLYTKRAVLNIGMLLRDSEVAKQLRKNILDTYEAAPNEIKLAPIELEKKLATDVIFSDSREEMMLAMRDYKNHKDQHINQLEEVINKQKPMVKIHDQLIASVDVVDMIIIGKNIGVGEKKLFEFLRVTNVLFKQGGDNVPYQQYQNEGYFEVKVVVKKDKYERDYRYYTTKVTGKGKVFISKLVDKYGGAEVINKLKLREIEEYVKSFNK